MDAGDSLQYISDIIKSCFLPELNRDLDDFCIENEHFSSYHECLQIQLPILYDWIQTKGSWIFSTDKYEFARQQIQANSVILLCELNAKDAIYSLDEKQGKLLQNAKRLLQKLLPTTNRNVKDLIFDYYKEKLHKDKWKRHLGAIHGFVIYLEHQYNESIEMDIQMLNFSLAVGLNMRFVADNIYKGLSINIFHIIFNIKNAKDICDLNIHQVIYDALIKDVYKMDDETYVVKLWTCLCKCLDFYKDLDSSSWSCVDDLMETLIRNIALSPNSEISICLLKFLARLAVYFSSNRIELERMVLLNGNELREYRILAAGNTGYNIYRWAKQILELFVLDSNKLMPSAKICELLLQEIHHCYLVTLLPIPLRVCQMHLIDFFDKYTAILMEVANVHQENSNIVKIVTQMLETFHYQLEDCAKDSNLFQYKEAYSLLLKESPFKNYISVNKGN